MIQGIFYARFFPQEGTKIVAQSPPGCIVPDPDAPTTKPPLFDYSVLQEYIIPRQAFCNRYITVADPEGKYFVLGFPVSIPSPRYDRNEFIFNFGLVVDHDVDQVPYERVVRRLAVTFAEMEKQSGFLSQDADASGTRRPIGSLLEIIKEDLNNYGECMIPVDDANTINMKLFPYHPTPPEVKGWHVPVAKMKFDEVVDSTWDLTLQRVVKHIDGVSDVRRIAILADVSLELTQLALRHLLYYDTILLLDMFFFGACYAPRPGIHDFIANVDGMVDECANYVCVGLGSAAYQQQQQQQQQQHQQQSATRPGGSVRRDDPAVTTTTTTTITTTSTKTTTITTTITTFIIIIIINININPTIITPTSPTASPTTCSSSS
ncbi:hypothetical protein MYCTH_2294369 [Thermothelomyces thermophilus ATCC 42464]|uniref:Nitrogen permease regulator 2 n=1 Tax=Thermothelomyces thermophilus (strain ATCC 42464 / BCRC 31852 / DSM 1799) TaxID=573729 RepID=G2Q180_THET4|nr:uncharacterized protein MYCTH_2294369 [Thermothelomyces thermophilus ATCC 42464]AEO53272.1 hypothetical protein MYCTH_2294369 [Thermothelomyces thermophilus ATCC 42464]